MRLRDRVALIAGAGSEIGAGIALRFAREGAALALVDTDETAAQATADAVRGLGATLHGVGKTPQDRATADSMVAEIVAEAGRVDILVNAADRQAGWAPLADKTPEDFDLVQATLREATIMMQAASLPMRAVGGGSIIILGSTFGHYTQRFIAEYKASKAALLGLAISAAHEWGPWGIRVNILETAADTQDFRAFSAGREQEIADRLALLPMRRRGDIERDIAGAALFLASDDSRYLTGEVIHADGGEHLSSPVFEPESSRSFDA